MAYQDVFVTITDINGQRQSYSARQKVTWVKTNYNFSNGAHLEIYGKYSKKTDVEPLVILKTETSEEQPIVIDLTNIFQDQNCTICVGVQRIKATEFLKIINLALV